MKPRSMEEKIGYRLFLMGFGPVMHGSTLYFCIP